MYGYIYKTTNLINGKIYIGQKKADHFLGPDYLGSGFLLHKAINKYKKENFKVEILCECSDKLDLDAKERFYISLYNSQSPEIGYNIVEGGQGGHYMLAEKHHSEKAKEKFETILNTLDIEYFKNFYYTHNTADILKEFSLTVHCYNKLIKYFSLHKTKEQINQIIKNTNLKKYGCTNIFKSESFKQQAKKTKLDKYGDPNYSNREKFKITYYEKYGESGLLGNEVIQLKIKQTLINKYGSLEAYHKEQQKLAVATKQNKENYVEN